MNEVELSSAAKALLDAAKSDGPSAAARAKIWGGVASAGAAGAAGGAGSASAPGASSGAGGASVSSGGAGGGIGAGAGGSAVAANLQAAAALLGGGKLLALGALFGSAVTVGVAATLIGLRPMPQLRPDPQEAPVAVRAPQTYATGSMGGTRPPPRALGTGSLGAPGDARFEALLPAREIAGDGTIPRDPRSGAAESETPGSGRLGAGAPRRAGEAAGATPAEAIARSGGGASTAAGPRVRIVREDTLMRESALVAEARGALMRGDFDGALRAIRATRPMKHRELEPEELSIEAHALRGLGRDDDAFAVELTLRSRFPDHALSR